MALSVIGASNLAFFVVHHVVRLFYEAANRAAALGFLGKERNTNPAVSKAPQTRNNRQWIFTLHVDSRASSITISRFHSRRRPLAGVIRADARIKIHKTKGESKGEFEKNRRYLLLLRLESQVDFLSRYLTEVHQELAFLT